MGLFSFFLFFFGGGGGGGALSAIVKKLFITFIAPVASPTFHGMDSIPWLV